MFERGKGAAQITRTTMKIQANPPPKKNPSLLTEIT